MTGGFKLGNNILLKKLTMEKKVSLLLSRIDLLILFLYTIGYVLELQTKYIC